MLVRALLFAAIIVAGCKGTEHPGRCMGYRATPGRCTRTTLDITDVDDPLLMRVRSAYTWQGEATPPRDLDWIVPRSRLPAIRDPSRDQIACERMVGQPGCPTWILPAREAAVAPPPPPFTAREQVCPAAGIVSTVPPLVESDLEQAFAETVGAWHRTATQTPDIADATYVRGGESIRITVRDVSRLCRVDATTVDVLLDTEGADASDVVSRRLMSATSAVLVRDTGALGKARLVMWVADRCQIIVELVSAADVEQLAVVGRAIDLRRLTTACAAPSR